jgi:hypothetical protein
VTRSRASARCPASPDEAAAPRSRKNGTTWGAEIILPLGAGRAARAAFVREIRARYEACVAAGRAPRSGARR